MIAVLQKTSINSTKILRRRDGGTNMNKVVVLRRLMAFWELFIGIGAVGGATMMFVDPSGRMFGMDGMLPLFQRLPFADVLFGDFTLPGVALLCINGLTNLAAFGLLAMRHRFAPVTGAVCGVILMLWICVQFWLWGLHWMSVLYFVFGLAEALTGVLWMRAAKKL